MTEAARRWSDDLAAWGIPEEILAQAPASPWGHPVAHFTVEGEVPDSPSHRRAREVMPAGGTVLDVGCGGGRATRALIPPARRVIGVDQQPGMLEHFAAMADDAGVAHEEFAGPWPAIADEVPGADVVVCHHVAYNVGDLVPFLRELAAHARRRVVVEATTRHPLARISALWERFWGLRRPERPAASDIVEVAREIGLDASIEVWAEQRPTRPEPSFEEHVRLMTAHLCLPREREPEVAAALEELGPGSPRELATIWWDASPL